ncbi:hypothetical protein, partial [Acetobacter persici]|uniref:hypothetical protein n=1 Tax=Acetobacter persici TaxID=1076596 RepID=UPI001BA6150E
TLPDGSTGKKVTRETVRIASLDIGGGGAGGAGAGGGFRHDAVGGRMRPTMAAANSNPTPLSIKA